MHSVWGVVCSSTVVDSEPAGCRRRTCHFTQDETASNHYWNFQSMYYRLAFLRFPRVAAPVFFHCSGGTCVRMFLHIHFPKSLLLSSTFARKSVNFHPKEVCPCPRPWCYRPCLFQVQALGLPGCGMGWHGVTFHVFCPLAGLGHAFQRLRH